MVLLGENQVCTLYNGKVKHDDLSNLVHVLEKETRLSS